MKKIIYLLGLLIIGLAGERGIAQKSASAVMEIRVEVIQGSNTSAFINDIVIDKNTTEINNDLKYGRVELDISKHTDHIASFAPYIQLKNEIGEILEIESISSILSGRDQKIVYELSHNAISVHDYDGFFHGFQIARIDFF
ncbi:MAG: hypothetical protein ACFCU6_10040 [Balneolaceae bacterium]